MIINSITLKNFRNHSYLTYDFSKNINILTGPNGCGKTNVVEAICYLSLAKSFRANSNEDLIKKGKEKAQIDAIVTEGERKRKINVTITPEDKQVLVNGKSITKLAELSQILNVVLFEPKDVLLFRGSPKERRNFLDVSLSKKSNSYLDYISRYEKVLKQRNEILKSDVIDETLLEAVTEMLIKLSGPIISYREMYVKDINDILLLITRALTGIRETKVEMVYQPFIPYTDNFEEDAKQAFKGQKSTELRQKATTIGIHREDFHINLDGRDIGEFGSQGENRIIALALKLSPYFLIEDRDKRPVVVLDDVMSELDQSHRLRLIKLLQKFEQVFITATQLKVSDASHYQLKKKNKEVF